MQINILLKSLNRIPSISVKNFLSPNSQCFSGKHSLYRYKTKQSQFRILKHFFENKLITPFFQSFRGLHLVSTPPTYTSLILILLRSENKGVPPLTYLVRFCSSCYFIVKFYSPPPVDIQQGIRFNHMCIFRRKLWLVCYLSVKQTGFCFFSVICRLNAVIFLLHIYRLTSCVRHIIGLCWD